jgi:hypothetical protein
MSQREEEAVTRLRLALGNLGTETIVSTRDLAILLSAQPARQANISAFMEQFEDLRAQAIAGAIS